MSKEIQCPHGHTTVRESTTVKTESSTLIFYRCDDCEDLYLSENGEPLREMEIPSD